MIALHLPVHQEVWSHTQHVKMFAKISINFIVCSIDQRGIYLIQRKQKQHKMQTPIYYHPRALTVLENGESAGKAHFKHCKSHSTNVTRELSMGGQTRAMICKAAPDMIRAIHLTSSPQCLQNIDLAERTV